MTDGGVVRRLPVLRLGILFGERARGSSASSPQASPAARWGGHCLADGWRKLPRYATGFAAASGRRLTLGGGRVDWRIRHILADIRSRMGSWRNWQTRKVEGLVPARACWFKSSRAHWGVKRRESRDKSRKDDARLWTLDPGLLTLLRLGLVTNGLRVLFFVIFSPRWGGRGRPIIF